MPEPSCDRLIDLAGIEGSFEFRDDMPRPQWNKIGTWIDDHVKKADHNAAWSGASCQWLERLAAHLKGAYWVGLSDRFALLTSQNKKHATELLNSAESMLTRIQRTLGRPEKGQSLGCRVILVFEDLATYYTYVCHFYPEGEFSASVGMCIYEGYIHIVLIKTDPGILVTLAHELTHAATVHLPLPTWIQEGIAQIVEQSRQCVPIDYERALEHKRFWRVRGLREFWSGEVFHLPKRAEFAYELAEILTRNLIGDYKSRFVDFLQSAHSDDAGEGAAQRCFGQSLAKIAEGFLGSDVVNPESGA